MTDFPLNERGGWIVPDGTYLPDGAEVPANSQIGDRCTLGDWCTLGSGCTLGDGCTLGSGCALGNWCKLGSGCTLGDGCMLRNRCTLGDRCTLGSGCTLGVRLTIDGVTNARLLCLSNVDGSGSQIIIITGDEGTIVRAGCFRGTVDEFASKARAEGKHVYAAVIPDAAEAFVRAVRGLEQEAGK